MAEIAKIRVIKKDEIKKAEDHVFVERQPKNEAGRRWLRLSLTGLTISRTANAEKPGSRLNNSTKSFVSKKADNVWRAYRLPLQVFRFFGRSNLARALGWSCEGLGQKSSFKAMRIRRVFSHFT